MDFKNTISPSMESFKFSVGKKISEGGISNRQAPKFVVEEVKFCHLGSLAFQRTSINVFQNENSSTGHKYLYVEHAQTLRTVEEFPS